MSSDNIIGICPTDECDGRRQVGGSSDTSCFHKRKGLVMKPKKTRSDASAKKMTIEDVEEVLAKIEAMTDDDEGAHALEDKLHQMVLQAIAEGTPDSAGLARAALRSKDIPFYRWYA